MGKGDNSGQFSSLETLHRLWSFFRDQAILLEKVQSRTWEKGSSVLLTVSALLHAATDTNKSIALLAREEKMRDVFVLARTSYETMLNACFILAEGEVVADKAYRHVLQKSWRDLDRELIINETAVYIRHRSQVDPSDNGDLQEAIDEFTSKRGREITSWTAESVKERIEVVDRKYGGDTVMGLQFGLLAIYRHASDIAHGTLFGSMFAVGLTQPEGPPKSPMELVSYQRSNLCMLLTMLGGVVDSLLQVLGHELGQTDFVEESKRRMAKLQDEPWLDRNTH